MGRRRTGLLIVAALIGVAGLALLVAELTGAPRASNATNERSTLSVPRLPDEALASAMASFTGAPPHVTHEFSSVEYIETTAGQVYDLFWPGELPLAYDAPGDTVAWVIVAHGRFMDYCTACGAEFEPYDTLIYYVPTGGYRSLSVERHDQRYDVSTLGRAVEVPFSEVLRLCEQRVLHSSIAASCQ